jgi:protein SERAC1
VHGITGNRENTWTHENKTFWPQDLLPVDFINARVLTFGYDADTVKLWGPPAGSNSLRDNGKSLAYAIAEKRPGDAGNRPLLFIVHSMGGLVCEQALLICHASTDERLSSILKSTFGIIFMGTPHQGSSLASWGSTLAKYLNVARRVNCENVKVLETSSPVLRTVEEEFQQMLLRHEHRDQIRIFCFYEEVAVTGVGKIVPEDSARLEQYPSLSIHANHMDMTKFSGSTDAGYVSIRGILQDWIGKLKKEGATSSSNLISSASPGASTQDASSAKNERATASSIPASSVNPDTSTQGASTANNIYNINMNSQGGPQFQGGTFSGTTFSWGQ